MPVEIKVVRYNEARLKKIRRELDYATTDDFFKTIPLAEFTRDILRYARSKSPAPHEFIAIGARTMVHRQTAAQMIEKFREGWRVERSYSGGQINLVLRNIMENYSRQNLWLNLIEYGSGASTWIARRTFRYFSETFGWVTVQRGRTMRHAPTKGVEVTKQTVQYIEENLVPLAREKISSIIEKRLNAL
jgi:hypothetical protein